MIYDLDLFLYHRHSACEIIVLRHPGFQLLEPVRGHFGADQDSPQGTSQRADERNKRTQYFAVHFFTSQKRLLRFHSYFREVNTANACK